MRARLILGVLQVPMRASPLHSVIACSLALALGVPSGAHAFAPGKTKGDATTKAGKGGKDPGGTTDGGADPVPEPAAVDGPPRTGRIYVDADGLGDAGPVIAGRSMKVGQAGLESQGVALTDAPAGPELRVVLSLRDSGGYRVEYQIVYDGEVVPDGTGGFDCQLCTEDELVEKVEALAVQVAPKLVVPEPEVEPDGDPDPKGDPKGEPDPKIGTQDPITDDDPGALGGLGKAGVALVVLGGLGMVGGVSLLVIKPIPVQDDPLEATMARNTKPAGGAVLGVGVAVLVTGVALLAVDRKRAKAKEAEQPKAAAMVSPWIGADGGGIGVVGRF